MFFPLHLCLLCNKIFPLCLRHHTSVNDICSVGRAVASWVASDARPPIWNRCNPISRLAHRLLHTSNTVFKKCAPLLFFGPPAAKSWRQAWVSDIRSLLYLASALTFTAKCWRQFQIWRFFLNAHAGHWKLCGGPRVARGPVIAHPWSTWLAEPFSKWGGTSARQKNVKKFCSLN